MSKPIETVVMSKLQVSQRDMFYSAHNHVADKYHTYNEIMTGPNPLTINEIRRLIAKRPEVYAFMSKWLKE